MTQRRGRNTVVGGIRSSTRGVGRKPRTTSAITTATAYIPQTQCTTTGGHTTQNGIRCGMEFCRNNGWWWWLCRTRIIACCVITTTTTAMTTTSHSMDTTNFFVCTRCG